MATKRGDANSLMSESEIKAEIRQLEQFLGNVDPDKAVERHIKLLHEYNESKDAAQALMGKLALIQGIPVRQLHEKYGLLHED